MKLHCPWLNPHSTEAPVNIAIAAPCTETIRHPAADRNEHGQNEGVSSHADVQTNGIGPEGSRHLRECRHNDSAVQILHEQGSRDQSRDLLGTALPKWLFAS
jgi:hypothetical protein